MSLVSLNVNSTEYRFAYASESWVAPFITKKIIITLMIVTTAHKNFGVFLTKNNPNENIIFFSGVKVTELVLFRPKLAKSIKHDRHYYKLRKTYIQEAPNSRKRNHFLYRCLASLLFPALQLSQHMASDSDETGTLQESCSESCLKLSILPGRVSMHGSDFSSSSLLFPPLFIVCGTMLARRSVCGSDISFSFFPIRIRLSAIFI